VQRDHHRLGAQVSPRHAHQAPGSAAESVAISYGSARGGSSA
jgi:hypothetical protein